eukprot:gb/GECG01012496.1/.p1 GENE.gb/GECG01012496.1/~~gb/GECG01012496.1/.p1  ORF type:complete len:351 (+),score=35.86 gb/GECG01012496.1/:1-1053(+)
MIRGFAMIFSLPMALVILAGATASTALAVDNQACGVKFKDATFGLSGSFVVELHDSRNDGYESTFKYLIGFCKNVEQEDINQPDIPNKCQTVLNNNGGAVAALQYIPVNQNDDTSVDEMSNSEGSCYALGGHLDGSGANMTFSKVMPNDPSIGFALTYTNGDNCMDGNGKDLGRRSIKIDHICADRAAQDDVGEVVESVTCQYHVVIESREGCPRECPIVESQGIAPSRVCDGRGVCRYSKSEGKPKCFCDKGYKGSKCSTSGDSTPHEKGSSGGAIAGGLFGGIALGALIGAGIYYYLYVYKPRQTPGAGMNVATSSQAAWHGSSGYTPPDTEGNVQEGGGTGGRDPLL